MRNWIIVLILIVSNLGLFAQQGIGSFQTSNGPEQLSAGTYNFIYSESLYLGPQANWVIDGEMHIYSRNIWISPTAKISGSGTLFIHNGSDNPMYEDWSGAATRIDGNNGAFIDVNMVLTNNQGLVLANIDVADYPGATGEPSQIAALKIGKSVDLRVDGASIYLNGFNLELSNSGELLNHNKNRMVVTGDLLTGHLIKNYDLIRTFVFPVGIAQGDYTPAMLTPQSSSSRLHVSVNSYAVSKLKISDETLGMDRVWNIFVDRGMKMDYTLSHNKQTNGVAYVDAEAQIVQYADAGNWIGDITTLDNESVHTRKDLETLVNPTLSGTWFTKLTQKGPIAEDDNATLKYGSEVSINVLENDKNGSSAIDRHSVVIVSPPSHGKVIVNADGSVTYIPDTGYLGDDTFVYEITDENGLKDTATVYITVLPRELFIPNVITPNGDGKNDRFVIIGRENYDRIEVTIINRWGNEVYRNTDYKDEWAGAGLNEGTYFPIIMGIKGQETRIFKGHVLIKRD